MFSALPILLATLLLTFNVQAFPKGGSDAYYLEHTPALVARYALPPAYHNHDNSQHVRRRRQSKRAVCPAPASTSTVSASASASAATATPSAVKSQPAIKDDGVSTVFSTRTTTVWTTKTAAAGAAATTAASVKSAKDSDAGGVGPFSGSATWFNTGLGACGWTTSSTDIIAAVSKDLFDTWPGATANPNKNPICGHNIGITLVAGGPEVSVRVVDRCTTCPKRNIDLSQGAFKKLVPAGLDQGVASMKWRWLD